MELIETIEVGAGGAASIEFTSIPQDADDLLCLLSYDGTANGSFVFSLQLNSQTNTVRDLYGTGASVGSGTGDDLGSIDSDYSTANTFHNCQVYVPNYTSSNAKSWSAETLVESNSSQSFGSWQQITAGKSNTSAAVTSLKFVASYLLFSQYTTASLYKITKA